MVTFEVGDRVEYTPVIEDGAYPGDAEQYRGEQGTVVDTDIQEFSAQMGLLLLLGRDNLAVVDVRWDSEHMRDAADGSGAVDPEGRTAFNANLTKIEEDN